MIVICNSIKIENIMCKVVEFHFTVLYHKVKNLSMQNENLTIYITNKYHLERFNIYLHLYLYIPKLSLFFLFNLILQLSGVHVIINSK